jgi:Mrp family chromosome partitioning ATPase/capsular polysaccharide biosynthesis protein
VDQPTTTSETPDLRQLLRPIGARRWWILVVVVLTTAATYQYFSNQPKQFRSTTAIFVQQSELEAALFGGSFSFGDDRTISNQASLLRTAAVVRAVARQPAFRDQAPGALLAKLTVAPRAGSDFIDISVTDDDPSTAAQLANGFATAFIANRSSVLRAKVVRARQAAQKELDETPAGPGTRIARENLSQRVRQLQTVESLPSGNAEQVDRAPLGAQVAPKPRRNAIFAALMSLLLAIGAAFGLNRFDRRLRTIDALEGAFNLPLLGTLPAVGEAAPHESGQPAIAPLFREACRSLRTNIELSSLDRPVKTLLVCSGTPGEGKSTVARSLALVYAEAGLRAALIEADVRRPTVSGSLDVDAEVGLTEVIAGQVDLDDVLYSIDYSGGHAALARTGVSEAGDSEKVADRGTLHVLPSGGEPPNPPVMLASRQMQDVLNSLVSNHDIVIIDSPPLLVVSDAVPLIGLADATLVVARLGETLRDAAKRVGNVISRVPDARALGVIANGVNPSDVSGGFRYYSYQATPSRSGMFSRLRRR